jgi:hypothetical protein
VERKKRTIVISAFPACGKSYIYKNFNGKPYTILDSDSSLYSWIYENGIKTSKRNPDFVEKYINHIKENIGKVDCIFVSSHKEVRKALRDNNIKYFMVYPALDMKEEVLNRMIKRGNDKQFITFQKEHYEDFISEIINENIILDKNAPFSNGIKYTPCLGIELNKKTPYITNQMIDYLLDDHMGNPSSLWWNY